MLDPNTKILIVEDFKTMRKMVRRILKQLGFENVTEADDGATALPIIKEEAQKGQSFQLVISDWNMPQMHGIELLRTCKSDEALKEIPFIMLTAEGESKNVEEAAALGALGYVKKPFTPEELKAVIEKAPPLAA